MRIRARSSRRRADRITLNLASMIDVTFLLLMYFMVTMVLAQQEDRLSPTLQTESESASGSANDFQPQVIEVAVFDSAPGYRIGSRTFRTRDELFAILKELPKSAGVFVRVSDDVNVGFAVAAVQLARDAGFEQVTYVAARQ